MRSSCFDFLLDLTIGEYRVGIRYKGGASCRRHAETGDPALGRGTVDEGLVWSPPKKLRIDDRLG